MIAFLVLETLMVGMFCALDFVLFYMFFEGVLIPMFLIIGVWGGARRVYSAFKFFLYTLLGSVLMLVAVLAMYFEAGTTDIPTLMRLHASRAGMQIWLWLAFFASFAVKVPMWPVHTWLPDAHVEAPTAGSVILAGVLLKMGGYGFLRFSLPMLPDASAQFTPLIFALSIVAIIYTSLVALAQEDMKKLIAYSSVAHMGFVTIGIFAFNAAGHRGRALPDAEPRRRLGRAVPRASASSTTACTRREIARYGGLVHRMPVYAAVFMVFMLASVGLPGTSGFVGEFLVLVGAFQVQYLGRAAATHRHHPRRRLHALALPPRDLRRADARGSEERSSTSPGARSPVFAPLVVVVLWMGIYPSRSSTSCTPRSTQLVARYQAALRRHRGRSRSTPGERFATRREADG